MLKRIFKFLLCLFIFSACPLTWAADMLVFECKRSEKGYTEEYEMRIQLASGEQKAKIFLDDRDLDRADVYGTQTVKAVTVAQPNIFILIEASFEPEELMGVFYPAGTVSTKMSLNTTTGKLKKVENIQGGILGQTLGNGTFVTEELCLASKAP